MRFVQAWLVFSGADVRMNSEPGVFRHLANRFEDELSSPFKADIEKDLHRTFPWHRLMDTEAGIKALRTVLGAYRYAPMCSARK
jgi:hypothetical protein